MNEPKLRFKADDGSQFPDWEEKKIGDITLSHNAGVYIAKDNYGTGTNIIGVGDIYESDVINGKQYRLAPVDSDEYILDEGDLVYGESSLVPEGIARTVCISAAGKGTAFAWHTRRYKVDRTIINPYFLTLQVNYAKRVRNHLMRVCTRNALTGMTTNEYFGTKVSVPCLPEQQKIAEFLSTIDTVIKKQKETVSAWEERKKGVMQKLFSQEVRFKADDGSEFPEWEEKNVEDVCSVSTGKGNTQDKVDTGAYRFYVRSPIIEHSDSYLFDEEAVITVGDGVGTGKVFHYVKGKYNLHQRCYRMYDFRDVTGKYFYYFFSTNFYRRVKSMSAKTSVDSVRMEMITKMKILVPCLAEQRKIADCLSSLDEVIEKQKATLAAWEELKKGLLQQMFV